MHTLRHAQQALIVLLGVGLARIGANVPSYSEYDAPTRYDTRRGGGGRYSNRQQQLQQQAAAAQTLYPRPGGGINFDLAETPAQQQQPRRREYLLRAHEGVSSRDQHKCRIWVPSEAVSKYPLASLIQTDVANKLTSIEVCCTGYTPTRLMGVTVCRPICSCQNGGCRVPGECDCYEGFVRNDNGDCVFACPIGCQNGRCYLDGSCQCDMGYMLDETRRFCRPICSTGCGNNPRHNCTEPEVCSCAKGYQLTNEGCQPVCDPDCGIGGICRDNNECDCGPGYTLKDGVCQSDCYQKCYNGVCVSRNRCICDPGFTYHEQSTMCVPV
ncbi:tenascin [Drosophila mojavensis]|uniref:EGF-like domain-containing protein n=1 Tax=Drosophila mojavensis TaxID=7230 RepID=B4KEL5_DROMO|nr:tenascin [Drosophila mojavensis]EDW11894.1 uncharacterized protein Dmoj_GI12680 [Drosophila mojavensis]